MSSSLVKIIDGDLLENGGDFMCSSLIKIIDGDLLESGADFICHQVNCQGKMGSGVALQIRKKYPKAYLMYKQYCDSGWTKSSSDLLGTAQVVYVGNGQRVINMFAQDKYGYDNKQYTSITAFTECLKGIAIYANKEDRIAFPYMIGCCRGGANWDIVYKLINDILKDYNVELWRMNND